MTASRLAHDPPDGHTDQTKKNGPRTSGSRSQERRIAPSVDTNDTRTRPAVVVHAPEPQFYTRNSIRTVMVCGLCCTLVVRDRNGEWIHA